MGFVQARTSGQGGGTGMPSRSVTFLGPNTDGNVIVGIAGWENTGPDYKTLTDLNNNQIVFENKVLAGGHRSQVFIVRKCKPGANIFTMAFDTPGGDYPSLSVAEYPAADVQAIFPAVVGNSAVADAGPVVVPDGSTLVQLTDATQDAFAAIDPICTLRTPTGISSAIRQAIVDCQPSTDSYDIQTSVVAPAPWATTVIVLKPTAQDARCFFARDSLLALLCCYLLHGTRDISTFNLNTDTDDQRIITIDGIPFKIVRVVPGQMRERPGVNLVFFDEHRPPSVGLPRTYASVGIHVEVMTSNPVVTERSVLKLRRLIDAALYGGGIALYDFTKNLRAGGMLNWRPVKSELESWRDLSTFAGKDNILHHARNLIVWWDEELPL